jgi:hypothetical protein
VFAGLTWEAARQTGLLSRVAAQCCGPTSTGAAAYRGHSLGTGRSCPGDLLPHKRLGSVSLAYVGAETVFVGSIQAQQCIRMHSGAEVVHQRWEGHVLETSVTPQAHALLCQVPACHLPSDGSTAACRVVWLGALLCRGPSCIVTAMRRAGTLVAALLGPGSTGWLVYWLESVPLAVWQLNHACLRRPIDKDLPWLLGCLVWVWWHAA